MQKEINLSEGYSQAYLLAGIGVICFGLALFFLSYLLGILSILFGVVLLLAKTGVSFSADSTEAMDYSSFLGFKTGSRFDLSYFNHVRLEYTNEATIMSSRGSSNTVRAKTYDIILSVDANEKVLLHEFTDYNLAKKAFSVLADKHGYTGFNEVAEIQRSIAKNSPKGRRR